MRRPDYRHCKTSAILSVKCYGFFNIPWIGLTEIRKLAQQLNVLTQECNHLNRTKLPRDRLCDLTSYLRSWLVVWPTFEQLTNLKLAHKRLWNSVKPGLVCRIVG